MDEATTANSGEPRIILVDRSTNTAVVLLDGVSHVLGIDYDSADGSIGPAWWRTTPEVDAALGLVGDDLLCELLSDAYNEQLRAEWA